MQQSWDGRPGFWEKIRIDEEGAEIAYAGKNGVNGEPTVLKRKWFYYQEVAETLNLFIVQSIYNSFRKTQNKEIARENMKSEDFQKDYLSMD